MAARTCRRASAAAAGPVVSRTRHPRSSVGRVGAITFIGFLLLGITPVAIKMVLQVAVEDIGQLTDLARSSRGR
jgi:hypothetical protein